MPRADPFTVEIIRNALDSISEQMASVIERTAYSTSRTCPSRSRRTTYPLRIEPYEMIRDSGGPGRQRGGLGLRRDLRLLAPEARLTIHCDRFRFVAPGMRGGGAGGAARCTINPDTPEGDQHAAQGGRPHPVRFAGWGRLRQRDARHGERRGHRGRRTGSPGGGAERQAGACNHAFRMHNCDVYITRALEPVIEKAARQFPAVVLTGPRQSGKTTLLRNLFAARAGYVSLEPPDVRAAAAADPRGFLETHPPPVVLDEMQYAPELLPYIKERIDRQRSRRGQYLLTGSQNLLLASRVTETLAGRAAMLRALT